MQRSSARVPHHHHARSGALAHGMARGRTRVNCRPSEPLAWLDLVRSREASAGQRLDWRAFAQY